MKLSNPKIQDEVGILLAVLSSESHSSSSTSELSSCSVSGFDYAIVSDVPPQLSELTTGSFWTEPFLLDNESIISSSDNMLSSFGSTNDLISQGSFKDNNIIDDVLLWPTMDF